MPTFKTKEDVSKWLESQIEKAESGEFFVKSLQETEEELSKSREGFHKSVAERKKDKERREAAEKQVSDLTAEQEKLKSELEGLKSLTGKDGQEALANLNKEKSDLLLKHNALLAENRDLQQKVAAIPTLEQRTAELQGTINRNKILSELRTVAGKLKVPASVVDTDLQLYADQFEITEEGQIFTKGDTPKTVDNALAEMQKSREHWQPPSNGAGGAPGNTGTEQSVSLSNMFGFEKK
ncbi:MAG: hypothetical protein LBT46_15360 [Planctomycetaceae bacterium]|jgi:chromosome segregation ATPase|nr:hypothetical protein [Planctomycetaceae bacterium]